MRDELGLILHTSFLTLHPSSLTLHSSSLILHPSSFIPYPSSLIPHPFSALFCHLHPAIAYAYCPLYRNVFTQG